MKKATAWLAPFVILLLVAGCDRQDAENAPSMESGSQPSETEIVMVLPVTTTSGEAKNHFYAGLDAMDMGRLNDANAHFEQAVQADPTFAQGYLRIANSAASTEEFTTNLAKAVELSENAARPEQLLIMITQKGFENDVEGQLALAQELVELQPESPRAWLTLAGVQGGMNTVEESRASIMKALELAPNFAAAHMQLGNNYLFLEPRDFAQAERHDQHAIDLAPDEPTPYDLLGDVHRAQGDLEAAYQDYTMAAERAPTLGSPLQQRGHVNSFLGRYDEARADYDRAMELETARGNNNAPFFAVYKSYVNIHAGEPDAAIAELTEMVANADQMGVEGTTDIKINCLTNIAQIATHTGDFERAAAALEERAPLMRQQAEEAGTDQFRRSQEAGIVYFEAMLAARQGDAETARAKAEEYTALVEPDPNPRKMEAVHQILGMTEFYQQNYATAIEHLAQGAPGNIYMKYHRALALDESGQSEQASALFDEIAVWNFNGVGFALIRNDVLERVES